ncbi:hypothetical protein [Coxiella endosymbiont of Amblyomma nuttalli]|uniref:hypothetical protein n=1 Tax=Coxiella endosymbiont of Amblyomma nuttalli TaxID=2749996 RepID=UPI001BB4AECF|nr:hypothetical protein [Coxiella endosymbiont of Amblyomma nuttalli]QTS83634.1 hypothetical protein CEAn_00085 [Coxiella endosymbiont of Amblyomma nuttalli]
MFKQFVLIILLSFVSILFRQETTRLLDGLVYLHNYIARVLHLIFFNDNVGRVMQDVISLLIIPVITGILVAAIFWIIKRMVMPHIMVVIWVVWSILLTTMAAQKYICCC